ncbi:MAG: glycosyltransferase family 4 protein [Cyanobacteria bacterium J06633_8]
MTFSELNTNWSSNKSSNTLVNKTSIKLFLITQFFPPDYAATGQLLEELVKHFGNLGFEIKVFTGQPGYAFQNKNALAKEQFSQVTIKRTRATKLWYLRIRGKTLNGLMFTLRALLHVIRYASKYNVLLVTTAPPFLPILGYIAHKLFKIPYICLLYDLYPDIAIALDVIPENSRLVKFWKKLNCRIWLEAAQIIVLSSNMKQQVVDACPEVSSKIAVIHSWGDAKKIVPISKNKNWFALRHNVADKFTVLYSGNMGRCHDIDTILGAAYLLRDKPIQFLCVGDGAKQKQLIEKVNELGLTNFQFLPYQEKSDLPYSLTACDLSLVSIDKGFENLVAPSKLYPALATGRPVAVVCPNNSYLKPLIEEGNCGKTFDNGDSQNLADFIDLLSSNPELVEKMGKAAREYMQSKFTFESIADKYLDVFTKVVEDE